MAQSKGIDYMEVGMFVGAAGAGFAGAYFVDTLPKVNETLINVPPYLRAGGYIALGAASIIGGMEYDMPIATSVGVGVAGYGIFRLVESLGAFNNTGTVQYGKKMVSFQAAAGSSSGTQAGADTAQAGTGTSSGSSSVSGRMDTNAYLASIGQLNLDAFREAQANPTKVGETMPKADDMPSLSGNLNDLAPAISTGSSGFDAAPAISGNPYLTQMGL
jgi:hypothetical protein